MTGLRALRSAAAEHADFIGPKVVALLAGGAVTGLALGFIEIAFAYGLQAFLVAIGVLRPESVALPPWLPSPRLGAVFGLIAAIGLARGLFLGLNYYFQNVANEEFLYIARTRLMNWSLHSESASTSEVMSLFNSRAIGAASTVYSWQGLIVQLPIMALLALTLLAASPVLTLSAAAVMGLLVPLMIWLNARTQQISASTITHWDRTSSRLVMSIKNLLLLQIYGTQDKENEIAQSHLRRYRLALSEYFAMTAVRMAAPQVMGLMLVCLIAFLAKKHSLLAPGALASYFYIFLRIVQTFGAANQAYSSLAFGQPHYDTMFSWWRRARQARNASKETASPAETALPAGQAVGWKVEGAGFSYAGASAAVLSGFSAEIAPGQVTVITGPSGAGKSTLLGLLLGNLRPSQGRVSVTLLDGSSVPLEACRGGLLSRLGYVGPESFLIGGTVADNLRYGLPDKPGQDEIENAVRSAECQFIFTLPRGLDHELTEQGQGLSAGQKQRLALARALLRRPNVLILDEATSNLDMETEARLVDTLSRLKGAMTVVAVTHRRELLRIADRHLELAAG